MKPDDIFLVGLTHRTAPLGTRERLSLGVDGEIALATALGSVPGLREFVILNTCNRVEIYAVGSGAHLPAQVAAAFCAQQAFAPADFERIKLFLNGRAAVDHLLDVVAGLDSQMIGENEIFGQVKKAFLTAQTRRSAGPMLNRVFQKAFQAAKQVRTNTGITSGLVSVSNVAVEVAVQIFGQLANTRVLLLGAGDIGLKSARAFHHRGPGALVIASRRLERAAEVAAELAATALPFETALEALGTFDIIVCSAAAPSALISAERAAAALRQREGRPLFLLDLALPRNVEAGAGDLPGAFLYNLDDLAKIAAKNRSAREAEIVACRRILAQKADALWAQLARASGPSVPAEVISGDGVVAWVA